MTAMKLSGPYQSFRSGIGGALAPDGANDRLGPHSVFRAVRISTRWMMSGAEDFVEGVTPGRVGWRRIKKYFEGRSEI